MARFDYLGTWSDSWQLLTRVLERQGTTLVPDLWYRTPDPLHIGSMDNGAKNAIMQRRNVFIWGKDFSHSPPVLKPVGEDTSDILYSLDATGGGPSLRLILPACYEEEGLSNLAGGMLVCHREYLNLETQTWERPSPALKAAFKDILARMKRYL